MVATGHRRLWPRRDPSRGAAEPARLLTNDDVPAALTVCAKDPITSVMAAARLEVASENGLAGAGGAAWGWPNQGPLQAVAWAGSNLIPVVPSKDPIIRQQAVAAFVTRARIAGRRSSSMVGDAELVLALWQTLRRYWSVPRDIRANQPSLALTGSAQIAPDPQVRRSRLSDLDTILPAAIAMFTEEVGYSPVASGSAAYRERVRGYISQGRSFARFGADQSVNNPEPPVVFKAEVGAAGGSVAQIQGVWVDPALRGRRLAAPGMSAVVGLVQRDIAPTVSLYVNGHNAPALRTYRAVGFTQVGTFATVLF